MTLKEVRKEPDMSNGDGNWGTWALRGAATMLQDGAAEDNSRAGA